MKSEKYRQPSFFSILLPSRKKYLVSTPYFHYFVVSSRERKMSLKISLQICSFTMVSLKMFLFDSIALQATQFPSESPGMCFEHDLIFKFHYYTSKNRFDFDILIIVKIVISYTIICLEFLSRIVNVNAAFRPLVRHINIYIDLCGMVLWFSLNISNRTIVVFRNNTLILNCIQFNINKFEVFVFHIIHFYCNSIWNNIANVQINITLKNS